MARASALSTWACGILLAAHATTSNAGDMLSPRIVQIPIDWDAARAEATQLPALADIAAAHDLDQSDAALARINAIAGRHFSGIGTSSVPVLIPFDADKALRTGADQPDISIGGFRPAFFKAGPTGYDAAFTIPQELASLLSGRGRKEEQNIHISGFSAVYDLPETATSKRTPVKDLDASFPGIARSWQENYVRYSFRRYGVPYVVSMLCIDGPPRGRWIACKDADRVIATFLGALKFAGGAPQLPLVDALDTIERPKAQSADFTYAPPGQILQNTGFKKLAGTGDYTVYAKMRFPIAQGPAFANSQSFMNWGNCDFTGRTSASSRKGAPYRCKVNDKPLVFDESAAENRMYPWRDNFCEHRHFFVGQCLGGQGHQGQDIRPATCKLRNEGADRCEAYNDDVVAVRDGTILRTPGRESMFLVVNAPGERFRVRYLHMHPKKLDADGMVNGRKVQEGEILGQVGNFDKIPNGTTYHLHFDFQVPTAAGWVFVNPYMTLVASYERLIKGRGREISDEVIFAAPATDAPSVSVHGVTAQKAGGGDSSKSLETTESTDPAASRLNMAPLSEDPMRH